MNDFRHKGGQNLCHTWPLICSTGTGKSLAARVVRANSETGGRGVFSLGDELTDSGTLMVEDVDSLSADEQSLLLEVLESEKNVRVIATTRGPLHDAVREGGFREDLYYRLNVLEIRLPDLADRLEDVPALA